MTEIQQQIDRAVREAERVRRKRVWLVGCAVVLAGLVVGAVLDYQLILPGSLRWGVWGGSVVLALLAARGAGGILLPSREKLAHAVEQAVGETAPVVATAIDEGARSSVVEQTASEELMQRVDARAAAAVADAPPHFGHLLRGPVVALGVVALAVAGSGLLQGLFNCMRQFFAGRQKDPTGAARRQQRQHHRTTPHRPACHLRE